MKSHSAIQCVVVATSVAVLATATAANAHARLVSGDPAENATIAAPASITLHFSEKLVGRFSGLDLMKADGGMVAVKKMPSKDLKAVIVTIATPLPPGSYMVMWHAAAADDGHRTKGQYTFTVH